MSNPSFLNQDNNNDNTNTEQEEEFVLKEHERELISLRSLKFDESNPNEMNDETTQSLKYSLKKWGMIDPIVIDEKNVIANGEHRVRALIDKGVKNVKVIRYHFKNDAERKLFRQTMNKLRGRHNFEKDAMEMVLLSHENESTELSKLIAINEESLQNIVNQQLDVLGITADNNNNDNDNKLNSNNFDNKQNEIDEIITTNKCPRCNFQW